MKLHLLALFFVTALVGLKAEPPEEEVEEDDLPIVKPERPDRNHGVKGLRKPDGDKPDGQRRLGKAKKLYHVQTETCLDFLGSSAYGRLRDCGSTKTKVKEETPYDVLPTVHRYRIVHKDGALSLPQDGKMLDAWIEGAWDQDDSPEQDWTKFDRGDGKFSLQDHNDWEYLDDWRDYIEMDDYNEGCTCQMWKLL